MKACGAAVCGGGGRRGGAATAPIAQQTALDYECMTGRGGGRGGCAAWSSAPSAPQSYWGSVSKCTFLYLRQNKILCSPPSY